MPGGLFITFEGGDGSGKSAQVESLVNRLRRRKASVTTVREPGGTQLGTLLRQVLKFSTAPRSSEAELLLFNASRAQLVSEGDTPCPRKGPNCRLRPLHGLHPGLPGIRKRCLAGVCGGSE